MALSKIVENSLADSAVSSAKLKDFAAAVDLNGVELVLDADADTSITADTDDRIDFKIANVEHFSFSNSSGDTIVKPMVDAKDIKFQQFDGRTLLDINDAGFVGIENGATGPGAIRIFEDSDNGSNYVGLSVGNVSTAYTLVFPNADGSSGQALTTNGSGVLSFTTLSANTPSSADGQALGSASLEWSDLFLADASTIQFGNDQDVVLTHVADTGLLLSGTNVIQFNDASQNIGAPSATVLDINATDEIELNATLVDVNANLDVSGTIVGASTLSATTGTFSGILKTDDATEATSTTDGSLQTDGGLSVVKDIVAGDDIKLLSDAAVVHFGADSEITLTHTADTGLNLKHTATADDKPVVLTLQTGETDMAANDVIGAINFQAPDESTGTDAILVAAGIEAVAEGDFSSSNNATKLSFKTGASEAAAEKMSLSSAGLLTIADDIVFKDGGTIGVTSATDAMTVSSGGIVTFKDDILIKDGGTIGSASDADAIAIAANGVTTFSQTPVLSGASISAGTIPATALDIDGATDIGADIVDADLFLIDDGAGGTNRKTTASRIKTYIGGGLVPITTQAFGTGTLQINNCFSATYVNYMMIITMLNMASDGHVEYRFGVGGSIDSSSNYSTTMQGLQNNGSDTVYGSDGNGSEGRLFYNVDADSEAGSSGVFYIHSPQAAYQQKHIHGNSVNQNQTAGNTSTYQVASRYHNGTTQQFTDISLFTSGGQNFRAGSVGGGYSRIAIYGITNS